MVGEEPPGSPAALMRMCSAAVREGTPHTEHTQGFPTYVSAGTFCSDGKHVVCHVLCM